MESPTISNALTPLNDLHVHPQDKLEDTIGLCLSGGGYRAMLFHCGALWRLAQLDLLPSVSRISSVSGGSITSALLGLKWTTLQNTTHPLATLVEEVVTPLRRFAKTSIDISSVLKGVLLPGTINEFVSRALAEHLFDMATLQDLPDEPRFIINATNVQSGSLWRFSKPYMRDYQVGEISRPNTSLAEAVAASAAFPPFLSPATLMLDDDMFAPPEDEPLHKEPYTSRVVLSDGGVYDNLGLETVWKRCKTVWVSDAGQKLVPEPTPSGNWLLHTRRILDIVDNQVRSLRKRQLFAAHGQNGRKVAYWGIRSDIANYPTRSLECEFSRTIELANIPTGLSALSDELQERLINWGYAICDASLRSWQDPHIGAAAALPYPKRGI